MPAGPTGSPVLDAFLARDAGTVCAALTEDAVFHSPVADYRGRARFAPVLTALTRVLEDLEPVRVHAGDGETVAFFRATVEGRPADGVLRAVADAGAPATELTLMVRPLETLLAGVEAMKRALGSAPG